MNEHGGVVNRLLWMLRTPISSRAARGRSAEDAVQLRCFGLEFFWPLLTGAPLVLANPGGHKKPGI